MVTMRIAALLSLAILVCRTSGSAQTGKVNIYVSVNGDDAHSGRIQDPLRTIGKALSLAKGYADRQVHIWLRSGTYYLDQPLRLESSAAGPASLELATADKEKVTISAGRRLQLNWKPFKGGIYTAEVPEGVAFEQLYVNGVMQVLARYPNYDSAARVYHGTAPDAISPERVRHWGDPKGGYVHGLHAGEWGSFDYRITGKDREGNLQLEGGWQNNRPADMHSRYRYVENIREELDTVSEWWLDRDRHVLYYYPPKGMELQKARIEVSQLREAIVLHGSAGQPLRNVRLSGLHFEHTERSFMHTREPLVRSDWTIYRGGAVVLEGTESCMIRNCSFGDLGGNAVMVTGYNRRDTIAGNLIAHTGASGICLIGDTAAVRSPAFRYEERVLYSGMDKTAGPKNANYPGECLVTENLIHDVGMLEKQAAGVEIDIAAGITVSHNTIYQTPRAGINIGDGCFGGHLLEYNDVFNTVMETGDHGAFNSWGRDRYWDADRHYMDSLVALHPELILLDAGKQNIIRNNRFRCDHGWDIDLDDGSSNYHIYNNVCLSGGLKLREGFRRIVNNNMLINNTFHPHVWFARSGDVFTHNIVTAAYAPILIDYWGERVDSNFFLSRDGLTSAQALGLDKHSLYGDAGFTDAVKGNWQLKKEAAPFRIGFSNFDTRVGVTIPALRKMAAAPPIDPLITQMAVNKGAEVKWLGARLKNIETLGERSAAGLPGDNGALVLEVAGNSPAAVAGLQRGDVLVAIEDHSIGHVDDLLTYFQTIKWRNEITCTLFRNQQIRQISMKVK